MREVYQTALCVSNLMQEKERVLHALCTLMQEKERVLHALCTLFASYLEFTVSNEEVGKVKGFICGFWKENA